MKPQKKVKLKNKSQEVPKVDTANDEEMIALGLRLRKTTPRDSSVWSKTSEEKEKVRKARRTGLISTHWSPPIYTLYFPGKLIVYLRDLPRTDTPNQLKSTVSYKCMLSDVETLLAKFRRAKLTIVKYSWNGKTYRDSEVPPKLNKGGRITK